MSNTDKSQTQELSTEEKAAQIGKDIGVKEEIPEYDIKAEDEQQEEQTIEDDGDKRLGKTRDEQLGGKDHKELSNREKRQLRKKRLAAKFDAKDAIINQLQEQLNATVSRLNEVDGKLTGYDKSQLDNALRDTNGFLIQAQKDYTDAFNAGDAAKSAQAMERMYEAKERIKALNGIAARQQQPRQQIQQQPQQGVNPAVINKANSWAAENPWYKADGSDEDSELTQKIAERLIKEGFDATTDDYWEELNDRLESRGIGKRDDADYVDQQDQTQSEQLKQDTKPVQRRRSPPVNGGGNRGDLGGGRKTVTLPTALINHMKEIGAWDDPVRKHRMIKDYQRIKAEEKRG